MAVFENKSGPESEKIKKSIPFVFQTNKLKRTTQCNLKIVDSSYRPFNKTNNEVNYIHKESNHPPSLSSCLCLSKDV